MTADEFHLNRRSLLAKGGAAAAFGLAGVYPGLICAQDSPAEARAATGLAHA